MIIVGLTGGIASGKTTASRYLKSLGAHIIDSDRLAAQVKDFDHVKLRLRDEFGESIFEGGQINNRALGDIVFSNKEKLARLNEIVHPEVKSLTLSLVEKAKQQGERVVILDVPLLFESGFDALCDVTWLMATTTEIQVQRVIVRDGLSREQAMARILSQMPLEEKMRRADVIIDTSGEIDKTMARLKELYIAL